MLYMKNSGYYNIIKIVEKCFKSSVLILKYFHILNIEFFSI